MLEETLTPLEYRIIAEMAKGYTERYVAEKMGIKYCTVTGAVNRALYKLRIPSDKKVISPKSVLIAMYRKEHPHQGFWYDEMHIDDTRRLPRNCGKTRGPQYAKFA